MNFALTLISCLLLLAAFDSRSGIRADELVQVAPRRAAVGPSNQDIAPPLLGYLARPKGPGRFPAVVLLHGCFGFDGHDTRVASALKSWGYVGLALDSLGGANVCQGQVGPGAGAEVLDAFAALRDLTAQNFVASGRIAVMGFSMGGEASLLAVDKQGIAHADGTGFRAAVAYYPPCGVSSGVLTAPALILVGERDDWTSAEACRKLAAHESDIGTTRDAVNGTPISLVVYPDATHAFDYPFPALRHVGHFIQHDEAAARDSETHVRNFLRRVPGDEPDKP